MWSIITGGVVEIIKGWFAVKRSKQEAEAAYAMKQIDGEINWDLEAMRASRYSWKDELIALIWFSPLYIGWFERVGNSWYLRDAETWVYFVSELPLWWQIGAYGIIAASFGLRWFFKNQNVKLNEIHKK